MNRIQVALIIIFVCVSCRNNESPAINGDATRVVKAGLNFPWEIIWGQDDHIWMTERDGTISRIDASNGNFSFTFKVPDAESNNEGGLLGMALHPNFSQNGFLYVVYDYRKAGVYTEKLVRYTFANN